MQKVLHTKQEKPREKRAAQTVSDWEAYNVMSKNQFKRFHFQLGAPLKRRVNGKLFYEIII